MVNLLLAITFAKRYHQQLPYVVDIYGRYQPLIIIEAKRVPLRIEGGRKKWMALSSLALEQARGYVYSLTYVFIMS